MIRQHLRKRIIVFWLIFIAMLASLLSTPVLGETVLPSTRKFDGVFGITAQRDYDNSLAIAFTSSDPPPPAKVFVVNAPGSSPTSLWKMQERLQLERDLQPDKEPYSSSGGQVDPYTQYKLDRQLDILRSGDPNRLDR